MNKIFKQSLSVILAVICFGCSQEKIDSDELNQKNYELESRIALNNSTTNVSELFLNMGVTAITVTESPNSKLYEFRTEKLFALNGNWIDINEYPILFKDGMISLANNSTLNLTIYNNQPYIVSDNYTGALDNNSKLNNIELSLLQLFMNEMIIENSEKIDANFIYEQNSLRSSGCGFWDTYYVYGTGGSSSVAQANLQDSIAEDTGIGGDVEGCRAFGGVDTSCLWGNHACVSTQAYCCDGYTPYDPNFDQ